MPEEWAGFEARLRGLESIIDKALQQGSSLILKFHFYDGAHIGQKIDKTDSANQYYGQRQQPKRTYTDKEIARALANIVGKNKAIDSKQKWAGAQWLLRWECNFPAKSQDFCDRVALLPLPADLEYKCEYNNIRALSTLSFMNEDPRQLDHVKYSKNDEQAFFMLKPVVVALMEELQKITI